MLLVHTSLFHPEGGTRLGKQENLNPIIVLLITIVWIVIGCCRCCVCTSTASSRRHNVLSKNGQIRQGLDQIELNGSGVVLDGLPMSWWLFVVVVVLGATITAATFARTENGLQEIGHGFFHDPRRQGGPMTGRDVQDGETLLMPEIGIIVRGGSQLGGGDQGGRCQLLK